jgi:hypothetical protein
LKRLEDKTDPEPDKPDGESKKKKNSIVQGNKKNQFPKNQFRKELIKKKTRFS